MINLNFSRLELSWVNLIILFFSSATIGANKAGVHGASLMAIPLFAAVMGVKASSGYVVLMYIVSDTLAIARYHLKQPILLLQLMPLALLGLTLGAVIGHSLNEQDFKIMMALMLLLLIVLLLLPDRYKKVMQSNKLLANLFGFLGGFTSMAGNIGGPVLATYLLSQKIDKYHYLSTYSWFFFTINFIKMFIMIFYWHTIDTQVAYFSLGLLPALLAGFALGVVIVKRANQEKFYNLVTWLTIISCLYLFYKMLFS